MKFYGALFFCVLAFKTTYAAFLTKERETILATLQSINYAQEFNTSFENLKKDFLVAEKLTPAMKKKQTEYNQKFSELMSSIQEFIVKEKQTLHQAEFKEINEGRSEKDKIDLGFQFNAILFGESKALFDARKNFELESNTISALKNALEVAKKKLKGNNNFTAKMSELIENIDKQVENFEQKNQPIPEATKHEIYFYGSLDSAAPVVLPVNSMPKGNDTVTVLSDFFENEQILMPVKLKLFEIVKRYFEEINVAALIKSTYPKIAYNKFDEEFLPLIRNQNQTNKQNSRAIFLLMKQVIAVKKDAQIGLYQSQRVFIDGLMNPLLRFLLQCSEQVKKIDSHEKQVQPPQSVAAQPQVEVSSSDQSSSQPRQPQPNPKIPQKVNWYAKILSFAKFSEARSFLTSKWTSFKTLLHSIFPRYF